jgi:Sulfotransferase family
MALTREQRVLIVGTPRSGSTWVATVLGAAPSVRVFQEPDNPQSSREAVRMRSRYGPMPVLQPGEDAPIYKIIWDPVFGPNCVPTIAKTVRASFSVGWLVSAYAPRVLLLKRHPMNVICSMTELAGPLGPPHPDISAGPARRVGAPPYPAAATYPARAAWWVGLMMCCLYTAARTDWVIAHHEELCVDPAAQLRVLSERVGISWCSEQSAMVSELNVEGSGYEPKRTVAGLPDKWRRFPEHVLDPAWAQLGRFPFIREIDWTAVERGKGVVRW